MNKDEFWLEENSKTFELGALFVRLFRSLDAITGGDGTVVGSIGYNYIDN